MKSRGAPGKLGNADEAVLWNEWMHGAEIQKAGEKMRRKQRILGGYWIGVYVGVPYGPLYIWLAVSVACVTEP